MESSNDTSNDTAPTLSKNTINVRAKMPQMDSLRELSSLLDITHRLTFNKRYGKILKLLDINVQVESITALSQFYDSQMRCFTFQDFQLAPTLEEFGQILGYPLENDKPYHYSGSRPSTSKIAKVLRVREEDLKNKQKKGTSEFFRSFFEESARELAKVKDWDAFMEVLALTIFGVVLFPNADELISLAAIDVFLDFKNEEKNPTHAVLADVYYTFNYCHEKKGKRILCCLPVLYIWLINHIFDSDDKSPCPIDDFKNCRVEIMNGEEWARKLVNLNEKTIHWYPTRRNINKLIYKCGNFPNVPLRGTRGCINYNPCLALRQLGYPIKKQPKDEETTPFVVYDFDPNPENLNELRKAQRAWNKVVRKGKDELGGRSGFASDDYKKWVKERVQKFKLPFHRLLVAIDETPMLNVSEDVHELKAKFLKSEEEKKKLHEELTGIRRRYEAEKLGNEKKTLVIETLEKRLKAEETRRMKTEANLRASDEAFMTRGQERDEAREVCEQLEVLLKDSNMAEMSAKKNLEDLRKQFEKMEKQLEKMEIEYKAQVEMERKEKEENLTMYHKEVDILRSQVIEQKDALEILGQEKLMWMDRCEKLTSIANASIEDVPRLLKEAEAMIIPFSTPIEIVNFIEHCQNLVKEMNKLAYRGR